MILGVVLCVASNLQQFAFYDSTSNAANDDADDGRTNATYDALHDTWNEPYDALHDDAWNDTYKYGRI